MRDRGPRKGKAVGMVFALVLAACVGGTCAWVGSITPVKDSPEEYGKLWDLFESEELLGRSKGEVRGLLGYPDNWKKDSMGFNFPNGYEPWDEGIHMFSYSSANGEYWCSLMLFFSDNDTVEQVILGYAPQGTDDLQFERQGIESEYH